MCVPVDASVVVDCPVVAMIVPTEELFPSLES